MEEATNNKNLKAIAGGAGLIFIFIILGKLFSYFYYMFLARLGPEKFGVLSLGFAIIPFLLLFSIIGLDEGVIRFVAYNLGKENEPKIKSAILDPLKIAFLLSIVWTVLVFIFSNQIAAIFNEPSLAKVLVYLVIALPFMVVGSIFVRAIAGFKKAHYTVLIKQTINPLLLLAFTIVLVWMGYGIFGAVFAYVLSAITVCLISFYFLQKKIFPIIFTKVKSKHYFREILSFSWPLALFSVLVIIIGKIDILVLGFFKTSSTVGIYNISLMTSNLLRIIPSAIMAMFFPIITGIYAKHQNFKRIYSVSNKWIFFTTLPLFLIITLFSRQILTILFGPDYSLGWVALIILASGVLIHAMGVSSISVLKMVKKTKLLMYIILSATLANVVLNWYLIPRYGMIGGATATAIAYIMITLLSLAYVFKYFKVSPLETNYWKGVVAAVVPLAFIYLLKEILTVDLFMLLVLLSAYALMFTGMLLLLKALEKEDVVVLRGISRKIGLELKFLDKFVK